MFQYILQHQCPLRRREKSLKLNCGARQAPAHLGDGDNERAEWRQRTLNKLECVWWGRHRVVENSCRNINFRPRAC